MIKFTVFSALCLNLLTSLSPAHASFSFDPSLPLRKLPPRNTLLRVHGGPYAVIELLRPDLGSDIDWFRCSVELKGSGEGSRFEVRSVMESWDRDHNPTIVVKAESLGAPSRSLKMSCLESDALTLGTVVSELVDEEGAIFAFQGETDPGQLNRPERKF